MKRSPARLCGHAVVNLVGDAAAFGVDGVRLAAPLFFGADVFHRDDHVAGVSRIGRGDDAHGKARPVPMLVDGLGRHGFTLLDPLDDAQDGAQDGDLDRQAPIGRPASP